MLFLNSGSSLRETRRKRRSESTRAMSSSERIPNREKKNTPERKGSRQHPRKNPTDIPPLLPLSTGHRPPNPPTNRLPLQPLHNLPHPPLDQHPSLQTAPLRSPAALLRLRSLPRPARARKRPRLHPHPAGESLPEPLRRQRNRGEAERARAVSEDSGGTPAAADWESGAGRVCAG